MTPDGNDDKNLQRCSSTFSTVGQYESRGLASASVSMQGTAANLPGLPQRPRFPGETDSFRPNYAAMHIENCAPQRKPARPLLFSDREKNASPGRRAVAELNRFA